MSCYSELVPRLRLGFSSSAALVVFGVCGLLLLWVCCLSAWPPSSAALGRFGLLLLRVLVAFKATRWPERGQGWPKGGLTHIEGAALSIVRLPHPVT